MAEAEQSEQPAAVSKTSTNRMRCILKRSLKLLLKLKLKSYYVVKLPSY